MECYSCHELIADDTPRAELLCRHTYHTICLLNIVSLNNPFCECGQNIIPPHMYEQRNNEQRIAADRAADTLITELKEAPTFLKDLRTLKKSIRSAKIARNAVFNICRVKQREFIAETRPYAERIRELQLKNKADAKKSPESKVLRLHRYRMGKTLRLFETKYPKFNHINYILMRKLKLPTPYDLRNLGKWNSWSFRRFFRTKPRLY